MAAKTVTFKAGQAVRMTIPPFRKGTVRVVQGTGLNAVIWVNFPGWHPMALRPSQITRA